MFAPRRVVILPGLLEFLVRRRFAATRIGESLKAFTTVIEHSTSGKPAWGRLQENQDLRAVK